MDEEWVIIEDFPMYKINTSGEVVNRDTNRYIRVSRTTGNVVKIGLVREGRQYTRALSLLVADAFVEGQSDVYNTPIHLDGNTQNNSADNLVWRSRGFAWKYVRQFIEITDHHKRGPIMDIDTHELYTTFFEAAIVNGLLVEDIWRSVIFKRRTPPTEQRFEFI